MEVTRLTNDFATIAEAEAYMSTEIDHPVQPQQTTVDDRLVFSASSRTLADGRFTNIYDLSYRVGEVTPDIHVSDQLQGVYSFLEDTPQAIGTASGAFFYHADSKEGRPRQLALNLARFGGRVLSLPIASREALVCMEGTLSARYLRAIGKLSLGDTLLTWSGSMTPYLSDCKVFGNGNIEISRSLCEVNGSKRVVAERTRYTPPTNTRQVDIGFVADPAGGFEPKTISRDGGVDLFEHDVVLRRPDDGLYESEEPHLEILSIDELEVHQIQGAFSTGPLLMEQDLDTHPINYDSSLGPVPAFREVAAARMAVYETTDGTVHVRVFDGRPGSKTFIGVTPREVISIIKEEGDIQWGCFLDGGHTARVCMRNDGRVEGYGNAHYLKWPKQLGERYSWALKQGRRTPSLITFH